MTQPPYNPYGPYPPGYGPYPPSGAYPPYAGPPIPPSLDFTATVKSTFRIYKARFGTLIGLGLIAGVVSGIGVVVFYLMGAAWINQASRYIQLGRIDSTVSSMLATSAVVSGMVVFLACLVGWWVNLSFCAVTRGELEGRQVQIGEAARTGLAGLTSLIPVGAAAAVAFGLCLWGLLWWVVDFIQEMTYCNGYRCVDTVIGGVLMATIVICVASLVLTVVSCILMTKWFLAFPVMVSEKTSIWRGLSRSWTITKGSAGMIFVIILLTGIAMSVVSQIAATPVMATTTSFAGTSTTDLSVLLGQMWPELIVTSAITLVISIFAQPILPIASQVVYQDRVRWTVPQ